MNNILSVYDSVGCANSEVRILPIRSFFGITGQSSRKITIVWEIGVRETHLTRSIESEEHLLPKRTKAFTSKEIVSSMS